jgi:hypothetical protein
MLIADPLTLSSMETNRASTHLERLQDVLGRDGLLAALLAHGIALRRDELDPFWRQLVLYSCTHRHSSRR